MTQKEIIEEFEKEYDDSYYCKYPVDKNAVMSAFKRALAQQREEYIKDLEGLEIDPIGDGRLIERMGKKFLIPDSVMAIRLLEEAKTNLIKKYKG